MASPLRCGLAMAIFTLHGRAYEVRVRRYAPRLEVSVDGRVHSVEALPVEMPDEVRLKIDGEEVQGLCVQEGEEVFLRLNGSSHVINTRDTLTSFAQAGSSKDEICAELPGSVVSLHRAVGEELRSGDLLMRVESMKMEVSIVAPRDGTLVRYLVEPGQSFERGAPLVRLGE